MGWFYFGVKTRLVVSTDLNLYKLCGREPPPHLPGEVLESVDVEVDGGVEDSEEVTEAGGVLHPQGPAGQHFLDTGVVIWVYLGCWYALCLTWHNGI